MTAALITGIGAVSPLGIGAETLYSRWERGECGLEDGSGRCDEYVPGDFLSSKEQRRADRCTQLAIVAAGEAIRSAGLDDSPHDPERIGCVIGTGIGGMSTSERSIEVMHEQGPERVSPLTVPNLMPNAATASVAIRHDLRGETFGVVSACAAGAHAIGAGLRILAAGTADAVVVGGCESSLTGLAKSSFAVMGATSPTGISRPFDRRRDGFVQGEGAGVLVLETPEAAERRGATALAEIIGYGATSDAFHLTAPTADGAMAAKAIRGALADAGLAPEDVDYVNAHGTSTPLNDRSETAALKAALGDHAYAIPVSSTKSVVGHLLGAAGAVEAIATVHCLRRRTAPPTVGYEEPEEGLDLNYVPDRAQPLRGGGRSPLVAISNAFGFGGHNAVLVIRASADGEAPSDGEAASDGEPAP
ncbi:MAG: beta-ketoacyl-ACP synthase II [Actinomycetota bacterium]|nr:beta-ketoacyl-ACP synthase II [Actinomycetota bacterium]